MHADKFFVVILSVFLGLVYDYGIAVRNVIVDRSNTIAVMLRSSWNCNG